MSNSLATLKASESETGEELLRGVQPELGVKGKEGSGYCGSCNKFPDLMIRVYD